MNLYEAWRWGEQCLKEHGVTEAATDAWLLLEFASGVSRAAFLADRTREMNAAEEERYCALVKKRSTRIPLQHLTGEQEFMGLPFLVNRHVLIPRQDTEILVEEALKRLRPGMKVLDLCTGSGCIAISLAKLGAEKCCLNSFDAADISPEALAVAEENGRRLKAPVRFVQSDLFSALPGVYDMIVSNPPYISTAVVEELEDEVRLHEPRQALDGRDDGLHFYRRIIRESGAHLREGGWLLFEIGYDQGASVRALMEREGYREVKIVRDLAGLDRVVTGKKC